MKQNLLSMGSQDSQNSSHQIQYSHLYTRKVGCLALLQKQFRLISPQKILLKNTLLRLSNSSKSVISFQKTPAGMFFYSLQNKENQIGNFRNKKISRNTPFHTLARKKSP
jgi:hypothetical protein